MQNPLNKLRTFSQNLLQNLFSQNLTQNSQNLNAKKLAFLGAELAFWGFVAFMLLISSFASGQFMKYDDGVGQHHDHHLAFFTFLSGMAANGHLSGIDFYSPHSVFIPIVVGIFLKIFGVSQITLAVCVGGVGIFIAFVFIYKTARLVMPNLWAKFAILTILISFQGNDQPWFNHIFMVFVAAGIYLLCAYIKDKKAWRLVALGFVCFCFPYLRQQGLVILSVFFIIPIILYHISAITKRTYKDILRLMLGSFLVFNVAFLAFVFLRNGFEGLEILYSSLLPLVSMAQPMQGYPADFGFMAAHIFNYTSNDDTWHGRIMQNMRYWLIVLIPCVYYAFRPLILYFSKEAILNEDTIKFIAAILTLSTMVFNYPIQEDARMKVQCMVGIWLFIDALYLTIYNNKARIASLLAIAVIFLGFHNLKLRQYENAFSWNYYNTFLRTKQNHTRMPKNTPYANLILRNAYADDKLDSLQKLRDYESLHPNAKIIFDGEIESIASNFPLLFGVKNVALAHKFPYYYQIFDREEFMPDINDKFRAFVSANKPIILGCVDKYGKKLSVMDKVSDYKVLKTLGNGDCAIFVSKDSAKRDSAKDSAKSAESSKNKGVKK
ncbi:hypothetical protein ACWIUD_08990 [Helicobacter sp. 23-1044]